MTSVSRPVTSTTGSGAAVRACQPNPGLAYRTGNTGAAALLLLIITACASQGNNDSRTPRVDLAPAEQQPAIPTGDDAYLMWDRWPYQRIGVRAYMRSTYDRSGGNETADASHFLYQLADDFNVTLDIEGRGLLYFARYNHWHGSPWHYEVDGIDHIVLESTTADPLQKLADAVFLPEQLFPNPLTWTYADTKGADLMWVPIAFQERFRMAYSRTYYGTGYYIYHLIAGDTPISRPIQSWDGNTPPDPRVLELLQRAGSDIAPKPGSQEGDRLGIRERTGRIDIEAGVPKTVVTLQGAPAVIRALQFSVSADQALALGRARLRISFDELDHPSIDAPLALFFGTGTLYNRDNKEFLVKSLPMVVRYDGGHIYLSCYFPMPFFRSARLEITGPQIDGIKDLTWRVRTHPFNEARENVGYFHASYTDHDQPVPGEDLVFLDTDKREGGGPWTGSFVGTSFIFTRRGVLPTLEGDPRFFFDDSMTPQAYGAGTEDWAGGGDYWGGRTMSLPLAGHPVGAPSRGEAKSEEDLIHSAYRFLLADLMPFGRRAVIRFEHGGLNQSREHYQSVSYWYGLPGASLVKTDMLNIGDSVSEAEHAYVSPDASGPYLLTSRYEWGVDHELHDNFFSPHPKPNSYADLEFMADADKTYFIWVRGRDENPNPFFSSWFLFDEAIGSALAAPTYEGPWNFSKEWAWAGGTPQAQGNSIRFKRAGKHRLRIQARVHGHDIDQIWLSATQSQPPLSARPQTQYMQSPGEIDQIVLDSRNITETSRATQIVPDASSTRGEIIRVRWTEPPAGREIFPAHQEVGRTTKTYSEFTVDIRPDNLGVMLRRTLDYAYPNQRALVHVNDPDEPGIWHRAGVWYLAGSSTSYHSWPGFFGLSEGGELSPSDPKIQTSNRRFRDDEFLIPRSLTRGKSRLRIRVEFTPVKIPLLPGSALPELAWSEIRYHVYSYVIPGAPNSSQ